MVQFGDMTAGWAIPFEEWPGLVRQVFRTYEGEMVFHNMRFDLHWLERAGVELHPEKYHDTKIMANLLDAGNSASLKPLAVRHVDPRLQHSQENLKHVMSKNGWTWDTVPYDLEDYWLYSALDSVLTAGVYEVLDAQMQNNYEYVELYEMELAVSHIIQRIENRGVRIDVDYCKAQREKLTGYVDEMKQYIKGTYGSGVTPRGIADILIRDGIELTAQTPTGQWQMTEEILEAIDHPLCVDYLNMKRAQKFAAAYYGNFVDMADGDVLHPDINPIAARTGRMSISRPALHQVPVRAGKAVRDAFIPREGNLLIDCDLDQVEQRLIAHYSNEPAMIEAFHRADMPGGVDFFTGLARDMYHDPDLQRDDLRRGYLKNTAYGKAFGGGPEVLAHSAKIPLEEAQAFYEQYAARFPRVDGFMKDTVNTAKRRLRDDEEAWVKTFYGRRLVVDPGRLYSSLNYVIQGTAADYFKRKLVEIDSHGLTDYVSLLVHDEVLADAPADDAQDIAKQLEAILSDRETFVVPITSGAAIGTTWGEVH